MDMVRPSQAGGIAVVAMLALMGGTHASCAAQPFGALRAPALLQPPSPHSDDIRSVGNSSYLFPRPAGAITAPPREGSIADSVSRRSPSRSTPTPGSSWDSLIEEASRRFSIPAAWVRGVMRIESGGRTTLDGRPITSPAGAMGLMQVMPGTFAELSGRYGFGSDPYDPRANILAGAAYLREMYDRYGPADFLAAYNAGPARVDDHRRSGRALPVETQRYVQTLAPSLIGSGADDGAPTPSVVRDLTSLEAMHDVARASASARTMRRQTPEAAPLFVMTANSLSTRDRHEVVRPNDTLFVGLTRKDRQRENMPQDEPQD